MRGALVVALLAGCSPGSFGAQATEVGVLPQSPTIQGRDGGPSGVVWGHSVWTFGDTVLDLSDAEGTNWHHNSFSITDDRQAADGLTGFTERLDGAGAPRYLLAPTAEEAVFNAEHRGDPCKVTPCGARWAVWPGPPIWDAARSRALLFYGLIYAEPGDFNFRGVGQSVAVWSDFAAEPQRPVVTPGAEHPTVLFPTGEPPWGTAALIDDDQLYAFGWIAYESIYTLRLKRAAKPHTPILVVGNLVAGGAGKTPVTLCIASHLAALHLLGADGHTHLSERFAREGFESERFRALSDLGDFADDPVTERLLAELQEIGRAHV